MLYFSADKVPYRPGYFEANNVPYGMWYFSAKKVPYGTSFAPILREGLFFCFCLLYILHLHFYTWLWQTSLQLFFFRHPLISYFCWCQLSFPLIFHTFVDGISAFPWWYGTAISQFCWYSWVLIMYFQIEVHWISTLASQINYFNIDLKLLL